MMANKWFYKEMGETCGPVSSMQLARLAQQGRISLDTFVRMDDDDQWMLAERLPELWTNERQSPDGVPSTHERDPSEQSNEQPLEPQPPPLPTTRTREEPSSLLENRGSLVIVCAKTLLEKLVKSRTRRFFVVVGILCVLALCLHLFVFRKSPTERFEQFASEVELLVYGNLCVDEDEKIGDDVHFKSYEYDIERTASTVTPLKASITIILIDKDKYDTLELAYVYGIVAQFEYRDDIWTFDTATVALQGPDRLNWDTSDIKQQFIKLSLENIANSRKKIVEMRFTKVGDDPIGSLAKIFSRCSEY